MIITVSDSLIKRPGEWGNCCIHDYRQTGASLGNDDAAQHILSDDTPLWFAQVE